MGYSYPQKLSQYWTVMTNNSKLDSDMLQLKVVEKHSFAKSYGYSNYASI